MKKRSQLPALFIEALVSDGVVVSEKISKKMNQTIPQLKLNFIDVENGVKNGIGNMQTKYSSRSFLENRWSRRREKKTKIAS